MAHSYLITGGAGNLALRLVKHLLRPGDRATLWDISAPRSAIPAACTFIQGDLRLRGAAPDAIRQAEPTAIIHLASLLSGASEQNRRAALEVNIDSTFELFESALAAGVGRFFFPSSIASCGHAPGGAVGEAEGSQWPAGLYGVTKLTCERMGVYYHARHGMDFRCLRLPIVISADAPPEAASAYVSRAFIESAINGRFSFAVSPDTRSVVLHVDDAIRAIVELLAQDGDRLTQRVYNVCAATPSADEIADVIRAKLPKTQLQFAVDSQVDALIRSWPAAFDDSPARRDWNWRPRFDLAAAADAIIGEVLHRGN